MTMKNIVFWTSRLYDTQKFESSKMTRFSLWAALAMAFIVLLSNILVQFLLGDWLTYGAFTYPFAYLVTDLVNRVEGSRSARKVVFVGFVIGILCSFIGSQIVGEFGPLVTLRIAIASGLAFLTSQFLDISIFNRLRGRAWWRAPVTSSLLSSAIDTLIFFSIAFAAAFAFLEPGNDVSFFNQAVPLFGFGPSLPLWLGLAVADYAVKLVIALLALIPYRQIVKNLVGAQNVSLSNSFPN